MGPWPKGINNQINQQLLLIRHSTEKPLEEFLKNKDYGPGLKHLGLIPMIFRPDVKLYKERRKYSAENGDADYRLKIDYNVFVNSNESEKRSLLIKNLLQAVRDIGERAKENKATFDAREMEKDIREFLAHLF